MKELQQAYEAILDTKLLRTTFQRRMLSLNLLERHEKQYLGGAHKAPYLYSFKVERVGNSGIRSAFLNNPWEEPLK